MSDERFGFRVKPAPGGWRVKLPHQCDSWDIVGEYGVGEEREAAVQRLASFIAEAQKALHALSMGEEFGGGLEAK